MKRLVVLALLGAGCLLVGVVPAVAKKKPAKPIIGAFEGTASGVGILRFEIEEFSTDQDIQELAQAYAKGGKDAVESALDKIEKVKILGGERGIPDQSGTVSVGRRGPNLEHRRGSRRFGLRVTEVGRRLLGIAVTPIPLFSSKSINKAKAEDKRYPSQ